MRLLGVELARLRSRRAIMILLIVGLASTLLFAWAAYSSAQPMSAEQEQQAETQWELTQQDWEEHGEEQVAACQEQEAAESEAIGEEVDFGCEDMAPQREWFFWEPPAFDEFALSALQTGLMLMCLVALLVGVTFVAAEFSSGSMSTWLTFEPRRGRVFASKSGAVALAGLVFGTLWSAAFLGATAAGYALAGSDVVITTSLLHALLRLGALGLGVTLAGAGLAFIVRHTAGALGVAAGYLIAADAILLGSVLSEGQRLQITTSVRAWVNGEATYYVESCTVAADGTTCDYVERTISMSHGGLVVLAAVVIVTVIACVTFRRRDVAG